jgi:predicted membrane chloride channel (bestrophin family)
MFDPSPIYIHCIGTFFVTAAFIGLELVSIELDDPFGHDANDFDNIPMVSMPVTHAALLLSLVSYAISLYVFY